MRRSGRLFSPALYEAAIKQVAAEPSYDFAMRSARSQCHARDRVLSILMLTLLLAALVPSAFLNSAVRWAAPFPPRRAHSCELGEFCNGASCSHGEPFAVRGQVHYRSFWKPQRAVGQFGAQSRLHTAVRQQ
jgi:hypothetical protein